MATGPDQIEVTLINGNPARNKDARSQRGPFFADFLWTCKESQSPVGESLDGSVLSILIKPLRPSSPGSTTGFIFFGKPLRKRTKRNGLSTAFGMLSRLFCAMNKEYKDLLLNVADVPCRFSF